MFKKGLVFVSRGMVHATNWNSLPSLRVWQVGQMRVVPLDCEEQFIRFLQKQGEYLSCGPGK